MNSTTTTSVASMDFRFSWSSDIGSHTDCRHVQNVNLWRDIFPEEFYEKMMHKKPNDEIIHDFGPGDIIPENKKSLVLNIKRGQVDQDRIPRTRYGRYYPKGILKGLPGVFTVNVEPFRCVQSNESGIVADMNHPLSGRSLSLNAVFNEIKSTSSERGGACMALEDLVLNGPGMQVRFNGGPTDFFSDNPFAREDESHDERFYASPRLLNHMDETALEVLSEMHGRLIPPGSKVLDLMSSWKSHLPEGLVLDALTGLGMNRAELEANPRLSAAVVHDLNGNPMLPFDSGLFDAVLCTASVEYLIHPFDVFADAARVLKPGGLFIVSFTNRWFPPKAIRIWKDLHEFERMGLVTEYFLQSGMFHQIHTWSMKGKPRPYDDKYFSLNNMLSDPIFMVWGSRNGPV